MFKYSVAKLSVCLVRMQYFFVSVNYYTVLFFGKSMSCVICCVFFFILFTTMNISSLNKLSLENIACCISSIGLVCTSPPKKGHKMFFAYDNRTLRSPARFQVEMYIYYNTIKASPKI